MAREGKKSARAKRKAVRAGGAEDENDNAKRQKTSRDEARPVLPSTIVSNVYSQAFLTPGKVVSLERQPEVPVSGQRDRDCSATIPVLPSTLSANVSMREGTTQREEVSESKKVANRAADSEQNTCHVGSAKLVDMYTTKPNTFALASHRRLRQPHQTHKNSMGLWKRLVVLGFVLFIVDLNRESRTSLVDIGDLVYSEYDSTANATLLQPQTLSSVTRLVPHQTAKTISRHLVELDEYERQKAVLATTESDLKRTIADLADSRHDAVAARVEAKNSQDAYKRIALELDRRKEELADNRHTLEIVLDELASTRTELERTLSDLTIATIDIESLADELGGAYQDIEDVYKLLEMQEEVATNALNFVVTTAIQQQQEAAAHAMNFVTTLAMKQKISGCAFAEKDAIPSNEY